MNKLIVTACSCALVCGGVAIGVTLSNITHEDEDDRIAVQLAEAPASIRAAVAKLAAETDVRQVFKETDSRGRTTWDVVYESHGRASEAEISDDGDILEISTTISTQALPAAAAKAVASAYPKGTIKAVESKEVFLYEVIMMTDGGEREVQVSANGQIADDDDEDADDEDEDDEDD
jgi:hypothetical protein